jgi:hypothetical protein
MDVARQPAEASGASAAGDEPSKAASLQFASRRRRAAAAAAAIQGGGKRPVDAQHVSAAAGGVAAAQLPAELRRGLDAVMKPLVKSTLYMQPDYPREHLLQLLDAPEGPAKAAITGGALTKSPKSRVRSKLLQYRDDQMDPLLLPALTRLIVAKRGATTLREEEAVPLLRDGLRPRRAKQIDKKALKKVQCRAC